MLALQRWYPYSDFRRMDGALSRFWRSRAPRAASYKMESWAIPLDVVQDDDSIVVTASLPGLEADGIDVTVEEGLLTISGETKSDSEKTEGNYVIRERRSGKFHRSVRLPDTVDVEHVEPRYVDGVLTVTLPKIEAKKAKRLQIQSA